MDGKIFNNPKDIPDLLHPNCQCWVEMLDDKEKWQNGYDDNHKDRLELLIGDTNSLLDEVLALSSRFRKIWLQKKDKLVKI